MSRVVAKADEQAADDVSTPEDFIGADAAALRLLDQSSRCGICSDLFRSPVFLVGCSHSFCSCVSHLLLQVARSMLTDGKVPKCIRMHIAQNPSQPKCPSCGLATSETSLKPNKVLEEMAQKWSDARNLVLSLANGSRKQPHLISNKSKRSHNSSSEGSKPIKKRKTSGTSKSRQVSSDDDSDLEVLGTHIKADDRMSRQAQSQDNLIH